MSDDALQHTPFDGNGEFVAALDTLCSSAQRSLNIFENDFEGLGFNSEARYENLKRFLLANAQHQLRILAHDPMHLVRYCPRIMMLLQQFSHNMFIYQTPKNLRQVTRTFAVADNTHFVRRFHYDHARGILGLNDPTTARQLNSMFDELWESSRPAASATTLGL